MTWVWEKSRQPWGQNGRQQLHFFCCVFVAAETVQGRRAVGRRCAMQGRWWRVICYISLMSRWPNGSRKSISFFWGNQSSRSHSPDQIFQEFPHIPQSGIQSLRFTIVMLHFSLISHRSVYGIVSLVLVHGEIGNMVVDPLSCFPGRLTGMLFACWIYSDRGPSPALRLAHLILSAPRKQAMPGVELK